MAPSNLTERMNVHATTRSAALRRLIAAPMAGGPSNPKLVDAIANEGGFGFLAGGYKSAQKLQEEIEQVVGLAKQRGAKPAFGVNLFAPQAPVESEEVKKAVTTYRDRLEAEYDKSGENPPEINWAADDAWSDKVTMLTKICEGGSGPSVISVTFGLPESDFIEQFHALSVEVWATVSTVDAAVQAARRGVDGIVVQGPEAGGHRATLTVFEEPGTIPVHELVSQVSEACANESHGDSAASGDPQHQSPRPAIIAAGGVGTAEEFTALLLAGADAVACGTLFAASKEAGTNPFHKEALISADHDDTTVTRSFSGRPARGRKNRFIRDYDSVAPSAYPAVHYLTKPIRAHGGSVGDQESMALWAGTGLAAVKDQTVREIAESLLEL